MDVLENFAKVTGNTCAEVSVLKKLQASPGWNYIEKEILAQIFSSEFCKIFKNTYFVEHLRAMLLRFEEVLIRIYIYIYIYIYTNNVINLQITLNR